jgi:hypothetical protein
MKKITLLVLLTIIVNTISVAQNHSLNFDGTDDFVDLEQNFAFEATDSFTIEAWVNIRTNGSFQQIIAKLGAGDISFRGWGLQITEEGFLGAYAAAEFSSLRVYVEGSQVLEENIWYHVGMSFNGIDEILLYVDGESESLGVVISDGVLPTISTSAPTHIGNFDDGTAQEHFNGNIDELRVWDGVRSLEEIANNYATELSGNESNLIGYYKMDADNSSCDVQDCNANQAHGSRGGVNGSNDLPQFSDNVPEIADVACGVTLDCTLSVEDVAQVGFSTFPNPTTDIVSFSGINLNGTNVKLYNILGSVSKEVLVTNNAIRISELPTGVYFMVVTIDNTTISKKIIKK